MRMHYNHTLESYSRRCR